VVFAYFRKNIRASWKFFSAALISLAFVHSTCAGASLPVEYLHFQSLCFVVEFEADSQFDRTLDRKLVNERTAAHISQRLRQRQFGYPLEFGRQCYPGKVGIAPRQLSLQFHMTLAKGPREGPAPILTALILQGYYDGVRPPPHNYPTQIAFCGDEAQITSCVLDQIVKYFDETVLPIFEKVDPYRKGRKP
jgi:hypothetical protein